MKTSVKIEGQEKLVKELRRFGEKADDGLHVISEATGQALRLDIMAGYNEGNKVGIVYQKYNPRREHQASEEGQAPASDTGRLANSVTYKSTTGGAEVFTDVEYGPWLEWGTQNIAPRPLWVPEVNKATPVYIQRLRKFLRKLTNEG